MYMKLECHRFSFEFSFLQTHNIGNNANIGIKVFTTWKQNIPVTKCYPSEYWTPGPLIPSPTFSVRSQSKFRVNVVSNDVWVPGVTPHCIDSRIVRNVTLGFQISHHHLIRELNAYCMHVYVIYSTAVVWFVR